MIIGIAKKNDEDKRLFDSEGVETNPKFISFHLIGMNKPSIIVRNASKPINGLPSIRTGSMPTDDGHYIFKEDEKIEFLASEPNAEPFLKPFMSGKDFINGDIRHILALQSISPKELKKLPKVMKKVNAVKEFRLSRNSQITRQLAETPTLFANNVIPTKEFLIIPSTSTEKREYIPIGYLTPPIIPSKATMIIENASIELFGLLTSKMHMVWLREIGGKLETRLRYSGGMVYNTFPTPDCKLDMLEPYAQKILDVRKDYPDSNLVDLYDSITMPVDLKKAHDVLDKAVEKLYRKEPFKSDEEKLEFLLEKYQKMVNKQTTL